MFELIRAAWLWKFNQSWLYDPIIKLVNTLLGNPNVRTIASYLLTVVCYVITISIGYIWWRFSTILGYRAICLFLWKIFPMSVTRSKRFVFLTDVAFLVGFMLLKCFPLYIEYLNLCTWILATHPTKNTICKTHISGYLHIWTYQHAL